MQDDRTEAARLLDAMLRKTTEPVPAELIVEHVLAVTEGGDWPVQQAAAEAITRRWSALRNDELKVAERPDGGVAFGRYRTRRAGSPKRPYETLLESLRPIVGSCDCPDFLCGSLGLCKHLLAVLTHLAERPRVFGRALASSEPPSGPRARLVWDPVRPLTGAGHWLNRVGLEHEGYPRTKVVSQARKWFSGTRDRVMTLSRTHANQPGTRLQMIDDLLALAASRPAAAAIVRTQPAPRALLEQERSRLRDVVSSLGTRHRGHADVRGLRRRLHPYQREGVDRFIGTGRLLLADDMGLGKTVQAAAACHALWRSERVRRGLVIVPASLKTQWDREWQATTDVPIEVVDGTPEERARAYRRRDPRFLIVNYEQVIRDLGLMQGFAPDMVVLDEAQRIKNWSTKTAQSVKQLRPPFRLVLTGTPMENRLDELASIVEWVDAMALEPKWRLSPAHAIRADGARGAVGARHLDTLRARLEPCMIRRVRRDVLDQLPPRTDTVVPVPITPAQADAHDELCQPIARLMRSAERRPLSQPEFLRLMSLLTTQRIIANGMAQLEFTSQWPDLSAIDKPGERLLRSLDSPKLLELREMLRQLVVESGRKVVVFSQWRRMLRLAEWATRDVLASAGARAAFFTGQESQRRRTQNLVEFHDDPDLRVLFATDAGGVGLNLQRAADCCINMDLPWNPAVLEQRIGRIHRLGQEQPVDVYTLISQDCIEERIRGIVGGKKALFDGLFDSDHDEVRFDQSSAFVDQVARVLADGRDEETPDDGDGVEDLGTDVDRMIDDSDEASDLETGRGRDVIVEPKGTARLTTALTDGGLGRLIGGLEIERAPDGRVRIEASPEAASALTTLFDGLARLLAPLAGDDVDSSRDRSG